MGDYSKKVLKSGPDRIGALPDSVLHRILSFLDMKEVVGTSLISKRWRYLWTWVQVLNFDHSLWRKKIETTSNKLLKNKFMNFVDRVLFLLDGSNVTKIDLSCSSYCDLDRFDLWMTVAARRRFQEIHLEFKAYAASKYEPRELPTAIFSSGITVFKFELIHSHRGDNEIQIPSPVSSSPQLKTLVLHSAELPDGNFNGELVLSCPVLENLELVNCKHQLLNVLDISTPQLKNLVIENDTPEEVGSCLIRLFTPNLESIEWTGLWYSNYSLGNLSSLVKAKIKLPSKKEMFQYFVEVLDAVSCATKIELSGNMELPQNVVDKLTAPFLNLRCLKLVESYNYPLFSCIHPVLKIFRSSSHIETLVLNVGNVKGWEEELYHFDFYNLKSVEIGWLRGQEYEIKLLTFILKKAVFLEKITIKMAADPFSEKLVEKIHSLARASSSRIVFLMRETVTHMI